MESSSNSYVKLLLSEYKLTNNVDFLEMAARWYLFVKEDHVLENDRDILALLSDNIFFTNSQKLVNYFKSSILEMWSEDAYAIYRRCANDVNYVIHADPLAATSSTDQKYVGVGKNDEYVYGWFDIVDRVTCRTDISLVSLFKSLMNRLYEAGNSSTALDKSTIPRLWLMFMIAVIPTIKNAEATYRTWDITVFLIGLTEGQPLYRVNCHRKALLTLLQDEQPQVIVEVCTQWYNTDITSHRYKHVYIDAILDILYRSIAPNISGELTHSEIIERYRLRSKTSVIVLLLELFHLFGFIDIAKKCYFLLDYWLALYSNLNRPVLNIPFSTYGVRINATGSVVWFASDIVSDVQHLIDQMCKRKLKTHIYPTPNFIAYFLRTYRRQDTQSLKDEKRHHFYTYMSDQLATILECNIGENDVLEIIDETQNTIHLPTNEYSSTMWLSPLFSIMLHIVSTQSYDMYINETDLHMLKLADKVHMETINHNLLVCFRYWIPSAAKQCLNMKDYDTVKTFFNIYSLYIANNLEHLFLVSLRSIVYTYFSLNYFRALVTYLERIPQTQSDTTIHNKALQRASHKYKTTSQCFDMLYSDIMPIHTAFTVQQLEQKAALCRKVLPSDLLLLPIKYAVRCI